MKINPKTKLLLISLKALFFSMISMSVLAATNIELPATFSSIALNPYFGQKQSCWKTMKE